MRKHTLALLVLTTIFGCDASPAPEPAMPTVSDLLLRAPPDFTPEPGDIPVPGDFPPAGPTFDIRVDSDGQLFRNGNMVSLSDVVDELIGLPNLADVTILIAGDPSVRISTVTRLQSDLSDAVPDLGAVVFTVSDFQDGG